MNPAALPHNEPTLPTAKGHGEPTTAVPETVTPGDHSTSPDAGSSALHVVLPADRLYWSMVEAPGLPTDRQGRLRVPSAVLADLMQSDLPVDATQVHAVGVRLDAGRALLCAADHEALRALHAGTQTAVPGGAPTWTGAASSLVAALNLLSEDFEPASLRRQRGQLHCSLALAASIVLMILSFGMWRRERAYAAFSRVAREHAGSTLMKADPGAATPAAAMLHLRAQREHLQAAIASSDISRALRPDAAITLTGLLSGWPGSEVARMELISLTPAAGTLIVFTDSDPKPFVTGLRAPPGWKLDEPRLATTRGGTQITLQMKPEGPSR